MMEKTQDACLVEPLTPRELEVLRLVASGLTNRAIGDRLFIAEGTAKIHVEHILEKLGVHTRTEAAVWFVRNPPQKESTSIPTR